MARGDILRKLFKSFSSNDREEFHSVALQLIQEEKEKNHILLARDLEKLLQLENSKKIASNNSPWYEYPEIPKDRETGLSLIEVKHYEFNWDRIILSEKNNDLLERIVKEYRKKELLTSYGLKPSSKLLFCGSPGCGKTVTAKVLASVLNLPLVYVNLPSIFSSYLGETAVNLKKIFDYIQRGEWVILFDEFDAIAKDRSSQNEHGEIQRLVNSLLQLIDNHANDNILIAATNHETLLDSAVWRRFDEVILFEKPNQTIRYLLFKKYLSSLRYSELDIEKFSAYLEGATGSDIERICHTAIKSVILNNEEVIREIHLQEAIKHYSERMQIVDKYKNNLEGLIKTEDNESI